MSAGELLLDLRQLEKEDSINEMSEQNCFSIVLSRRRTITNDANSSPSLSKHNLIGPQLLTTQLLANEQLRLQFFENHEMWGGGI